MQAQRYYKLNFQSIEEIILSLGDEFDIRIEVNAKTGLFAVSLGLVGTVVGGLIAGRVGSLVGAGIGSISAIGVSQLVALREIWPKIKDTLTQIYYIVYNFLRQLDSEDYVRAITLCMSARNKTQLVLCLVNFIAEIMTTRVSSSICYNT